VSAREVAASTIQRHGDDLIGLSHFIHAHPELGYVEFESSDAVATLAEGPAFASSAASPTCPRPFERRWATAT
jgi:metal-dependent amidase/aminoacylase/carboxypeptidase family protein